MGGDQFGDGTLEVDVVVLGSGGPGLTAATVAHDFGAGEVVILEKSGMVGGTTAMSGGLLWIPLNHHQAEAGVEDSYDDVVAYLDALAPGLLDPDLLAAFLDNGPEMVRHMEANTPLRLHLHTTYPDYQPAVIGAMANGGRSLDPAAYPFEELGSWATRVNPPKTGLPRVTSMVEDHLVRLSKKERQQRRARDFRGNGQGLVGALLRGVVDRDIPIHFETRARNLLKESGRITGVVAEGSGGSFTVRARKGVIVATGGFEWNERLVKTFLRGPMTGPASVPENEGDGLQMALEVGAGLRNMSEAWWFVTTRESAAGHRDAKANYLLCNNERTFPGSIMVNRAAKRFVNEALNYNALGHVLHDFDPIAHDYPNLPCWVVFDDRFRTRYPVFTSGRGQEPPPWTTKADTLEELGASLGIDGDVLRATVERFNDLVRRGHDDDFGRGDSTYDNFWGDPSFEAPFRTLGLIDEPPYYAIELESGVLGTSGGPKANEHAQVLDWKDEPIEGLYVCGNVMGAATGPAYGGAGGTIGPGMTFGFVAGRHAARQHR